MSSTVFMPALGSMGAAIAGCLTQNGTRVLTSLDGRSAETRARANAAGVENVSAATAVAESDFVLSVAPPDQAARIAERFVELSRQSGRQPIFADMNAISPETATRIGVVVQGADARFVDGGIIGMPPAPGKAGPVLYVSGPDAGELEQLDAPGLRIRNLDAPIGAASALKLSYAGITKGLIALGASMMLAASRAGVAQAFAAELAASQSRLLEGFNRSVPDMLPKAARWVPEMQEISAFVGADLAEAELYGAMAGFYERIAHDQDAGGEEAKALDAFLALAAEAVRDKTS